MPNKKHHKKPNSGYYASHYVSKIGVTMYTELAVGEVELIIVGRVLGIDFRLIPASDAAKKHGYHIRTIQRWADNGEIIASKISGRWYVHDQLIKISRVSGGLECSELA